MMDFNCCTNGQLPDLSESTAIEITAVFVEMMPDGSTCCVPIFGIASGRVSLEESISDDEGELIYTVYHRDSEGYAYALHDEDFLDDAKRVAEAIITLYPHLTVTLN